MKFSRSARSGTVLSGARLPTVMVVSIAVLSSLVTVGALELLRGEQSIVYLSDAVEQPPKSAEPTDTREHEPLAAQAPSGFGERLAELERRLANLEAGSFRAPAALIDGSEGQPQNEELRALVFEWMAEERAELNRAAELAQADAARSEREFEAQFRAHMLAQQHDLVEWQEQRMAALFLEVADRSAELEATFDLDADGIESIEAQFEEFEVWCEQREREVTAEVDSALYQAIYADD